jgi:hypothetical protein
MVGIIVNVLCVALGGLAGAVFGKFLSKDFTEKLNSVFGICAMGMGISSIILMENMPAVILAVVIGTALGLALHFGQRISAAAALMEKPLKKLVHTQNSQDPAYASLMVTAVVLFCTSGTGIYGSLDAGMTGSITILLSKSVLDFFTAMVFACTLGLVTAVIAVPQFVIFTCLFLLAKVIFPLTTPSMILDFKACGGLLLLATGLRIAKIKEFPIADMVPAMILVMPLSGLWTAYIAPLF